MSDVAIADAVVEPVGDDRVGDSNEPTPLISEDLVRSLCLRFNPFVAVGRETPAANLASRGFLVDVVDKLGGWDQAAAAYPEVSSFASRVRAVLTELADDGRNGEG